MLEMNDKNAYLKAAGQILLCGLAVTGVAIGGVKLAKMIKAANAQKRINIFENADKEFTSKFKSIHDIGSLKRLVIDSNYYQLRYIKDKIDKPGITDVNGGSMLSILEDVNDRIKVLKKYC